MLQANELELTSQEITLDNSTEFSMQVVLEDSYDESIEQEILEISSHIKCEFVFRSPKKALC